MEQNDYPNSAAMKKIFSDRVQQNKMMQEQMQLQQIGGAQNAVPVM